MADTGWVAAGTAQNVAVSGGVNWQNPTNITTITDSTWASSGSITANTPTSYLHATNFGISIPIDADVVGVEVRVRGQAALSSGGSGSPQFSPTSGMLLISNTATGNNQFSSLGVWTGSYSNKDGGGPSNTWGTSLTPSIINSPNFGFRFQGLIANAKNEGRISTIWMRIHYEVGGRAFVKDGGVWKEGAAYVRDGGIWKQSQQYIREGGVWKS